MENKRFEEVLEDIRKENEKYLSLREIGTDQKRESFTTLNDLYAKALEIAGDNKKHLLSLDELVLLFFKAKDEIKKRLPTAK